MTTIDYRDTPYHKVTLEEAREAEAEALASCGLTLEELKSEAARHRFSSLDARIAWITVRATQTMTS